MAGYGKNGARKPMSKATKAVKKYAAVIGRRKYGTKKMASLAAKGRKK